MLDVTRRFPNASLWTKGELDFLQTPPPKARAGLDAIGGYQPLPTGQALLEHWIGELTGGAARMLRALVFDRARDDFAHQFFGVGHARQFEVAVGEAPQHAVEHLWPVAAYILGQRLVQRRRVLEGTALEFEPGQRIARAQHVRVLLAQYCAPTFEDCPEDVFGARVLALQHGDMREPLGDLQAQRMLSAEHRLGLAVRQLQTRLRLRPVAETLVGTPHRVSHRGACGRVVSQAFGHARRGLVE